MKKAWTLEETIPDCKHLSHHNTVNLNLNLKLNRMNICHQINVKPTNVKLNAKDKNFLHLIVYILNEQRSKNKQNFLIKFKAFS